jgi:hypothetical protein
MAAKLKEVKTSLMLRRHWPIEVQGRWLGSVVRGHLAYYSVPGNIQQVSAFRATRSSGSGEGASASQPEDPDELGPDAPPRGSVPPSRPLHTPWPNERFAAKTQVRSPVR